MQRRQPVNSVSYTIEVIVISLLAVLLAAGFGVMAITGPSAGMMTGYNAGLTMIVVASVMGVGAGAIHYHRMHSDETAALSKKVGELSEENAALREAQDQLRTQIGEVQKDLRAVMALLTARSGALADELAGRRHSRN